MAYLDDNFEEFDDEGVSTLLESDEFEGWEPAGSGEAIGPRYRRSAVRTPISRIPRPTAPRPVGGLGGATINTPAGRAQVRFEKPLATKESVEAQFRELKREIAAQASATAAAVKKIDDTLDRNTAILDKKAASLEAMVKKQGQGSQLGFMLPLLLTKPPQIETVKVKNPVTSADVTVTVTDTKYKEGDNLGLLIALMAMSGGLGGGSGDSNNMLFIALALSGALGGK